MKPLVVFHLVTLIFIITESSEALILAKKGCEEKCGEVMIPFPFGIGAPCALNEWYAVDCNLSIPYLSAFRNAKVLKVSLEKQIVTVNVSMTFDCRNRVYHSSKILVPNDQVDVSLNPYLFCSRDNLFLVEGCGNAVITTHGTVVSGCSSTCHNDTLIGSKNCFGIGCCQTRIPYHLHNFTLNLTGMERHGGSGTCGSAFLVDKSSYANGNFSSQPNVKDYYTVPMSLFWPLTFLHEREILNFRHPECTSLQLLIGDRSLENYTKCECSIKHEGNPYLPNGCKEIEECTRCEDAGGLCERRSIFDDLNTQDIWFTSCNYDFPYPHKTSLAVILGASISMGLLFLMAFIYVQYKIIKKTIAKRERDKFFKRNSGILVKQQEATNTSLVDKTILFTLKELEKATDVFNDNRIIGRGGQGTVYKGMLIDGRIVAVKKSNVIDESKILPVINEVVILSQVNHRNVVKLLGCCLETEVPLLVFEYISNGTLYDLIQHGAGEFPFSLNKRIEIAIDIADALSYLHAATSIPIYHRDIKTTNILLDEKYRAKVSDFGTSRFVSIDQTHLTTFVKGTFGYFDPQYFQSSRLTEKSDVYSFGVVLLELLTGEKPILSCGGEHESLAAHFMLAMEEGRVMSIFDPVLVKEGSKGDLLALANLAMRCLHFKANDRPTMKKVALELEGMRKPQMFSTLQTSFGHVTYGEDLQMFSYDESTSTSTTTTTSSSKTKLTNNLMR